MKERDEKRPGGSLQQPSVTPAHPGTNSNLSLERNVQVWPQERLRKQGRAPGRSAHVAAAANSSLPFRQQLASAGADFSRMAPPVLSTLRRITVDFASGQQHRGQIWPRRASANVSDSYLNTAASTSATDSTHEPSWRSSPQSFFCLQAHQMSQFFFFF